MGVLQTSHQVGHNSCYSWTDKTSHLLVGSGKAGDERAGLFICLFEEKHDFKTFKINILTKVI